MRKARIIGAHRVNAVQIGVLNSSAVILVFEQLDVGTETRIALRDRDCAITNCF
jgi:hypothetical protein